MSLTFEQSKFLEECEEEFAERYTDEDPEYKKVLEEGIPSPPIVYPWNRQFRYNNRNRSGPRPGPSRNYHNNGDQDESRGYNDHHQYRQQHRNEHRYRPYDN